MRLYQQSNYISESGLGSAKYSEVETLDERIGHHTFLMEGYITAYFTHCILPLSNGAFVCVQNFNVLIPKAPVDAETVMLWRCLNRSHIVTAEKDDVLFLVGWRKKALPSFIQSLIGDI